VSGKREERKERARNIKKNYDKEMTEREEKV